MSMKDIEIDSTVYTIKKRKIYERKIKYINETHAIVFDPKSKSDSLLYCKVALNQVYSSYDLAIQSISEQFKKGDLVACVKDLNQVKEGIVVDVNSNFVSVLIEEKVCRFSKSNALKLN